MAFEPKDPIEFFSRLGRKRVAEALTRGEIKDELRPQAIDWLSFGNMLAGWWTFRVSKWNLVAAVVTLALAAVAYFYPPHV